MPLHLIIIGQFSASILVFFRMSLVALDMKQA